MRCRINAGTRLYGILIAAALTVAACGGGGGGGGGAAATPGSKLFVADSGNAAIGSFVNSNPSAGTIVVDRIIAGSNTSLPGNITGLALDAVADRLYVVKDEGVFAFNNASTASGNLIPNRKVASFISTATFTSLYLDTAGDVLYVGDGANGVRVYNGASTLNELGGPTTVPTRTITGDFGTSYYIRGVAVDVLNNTLYVATIIPTPPSILINVFDNQSGLASGSHTPDRRITIAGNAGMGGIYLDSAGNRLYASDNVGNVFVFDNARARNDPTTPDRTILLGVSAAAKLAVDTTNNRLYAATSGALFIVPTASTGTGTVPGTVAGLAPVGGNLTGVAVKP